MTSELTYKLNSHLVAPVAEVGWLPENKVLLINYTKIPRLKEAQLHVKMTKEKFYIGDTIPTITTFNKGLPLATVSRDVRTYFAADEVTCLNKAYAFVVRNQMTRVFASLFLLLDKPPLPSKMFTSIEDTESWLLTI